MPEKELRTFRHKAFNHKNSPQKMKILRQSSTLENKGSSPLADQLNFQWPFRRDFNSKAALCDPKTLCGPCRSRSDCKKGGGVMFVSVYSMSRPVAHLKDAP